MKRRSAGAIVLVAWVLLGGACGPPSPPRGGEPALADIERFDNAEAAREASRACFARGVYAREAGDAAEALAQFEAAVRFYPQDAQARLTYAEFLVELGRTGDAKSFLLEAVKRFGGTGPEHLMLARLHLLDSETAQATAQVDSALAHDRTLADGWRLRGRLALDDGKSDDAYTSFQRADSLQPYDPSTLEGLAAAARAAGRPDEARALLERVLQLDPTSQSARRNLAGLYTQEGRKEDARRLAMEGLKVDPDDPARIDAALEALLDSGDPEGAADLLRPYHERDVLGPRLEYLYARVLMHLDRLAAADSVLQRLSEFEGLQGVEVLRGEVAARSGRAEEARAHYRKAIAQRPEDCVPYASLALLAAQEAQDAAQAGKPAPSIDSTLVAAERRTGPDNFRCNVLLGLAGMAARRFDFASRHLAAASKLDPENREVLLDLAMAQQEAGEPEAAMRAAREVLRLDPENPAALNFVGYVMAERGEQLPESERLIRKALEKDPDNGYYVDSLGWVLYQKGEFDAAVTELRRAVQLTEGKDALILEHLGDACAKAGRLTEARDSYARARELDPARTLLASKLADVESRLRRP